MLKDPIQIIDPASLVGNSRETFHKSGTDGSNPVPSSGESANFRFLASIIRAGNPAGGAPLARRSTRAAVDILEGLIRQGIDRDTAEESADNPVAPRRPKAAYSSVLCAYIAHHKTTAVQEMLFACPRKAKEVAVVLRLKQFRPHEAMKALAKEAEPQSAYAVLEGQFRQFAATLGFSVEAEAQRRGWASSCSGSIISQTYERKRSPHIVNIPRALFTGRTGREPRYHVAIEELQDRPLSVQLRDFRRGAERARR